MASQEANSQPQQQASAPAHHSTPVLPNYPELILAAIEALNDKNGSNKSSISRQIEATINDVPAAHTTLLTHHLNRMKQSGQLIMVKNNYMVPDPDAPPKRGRGRPPKAKEPGAEVQPPRSPRPRGRPPKSRDPNASHPPPPKPMPQSPGSGRKRGRPPKKTNTEAGSELGSSGSVSVTLESGVKRGRGRPPKTKPAVEPVAS